MYMDTIKTQLNFGWESGGRGTWRRWSRLEQGGELFFNVYGHNKDLIKFWVGEWGEGYLEKVEKTGAGWRSVFGCILIINLKISSIPKFGSNRTGLSRDEVTGKKI